VCERDRLKSGEFIKIVVAEKQRAALFRYGLRALLLSKPRGDFKTRTLATEARRHRERENKQERCLENFYRILIYLLSNLSSLCLRWQILKSVLSQIVHHSVFIATHSGFILSRLDVEKLAER
jgi:hypothetical protein